MRTFWKWVLGIIIALVVIAAVAGFGFWVYTRWTGGGWMMPPRAIAPRFAPQKPDAEDWRDWGRRMPMFPFNYMPHSRMPGGFWGGFLPLSFWLGVSFRLGLLALIVIGVIALARLAWGPKPAQVQPQPPVAPAPGEAASNCPSCGYAIQAGWKHCPNCGSALST